MILKFKNYTITITLNKTVLVKSSIPEMEAVDIEDLKIFFANEILDKTSDLGKLYALSNSKKVIYKKINTIYSDRINSILSLYPNEEITSWTTKAIQAEHWLAASDAGKTELLNQLPMLVSEANSSEFAVITDLATRIKRKSDLYQAFHGEQTRIRYDLTDRLDLVTNEQELEEFKIYMNNMLTLG